MKPFATALGLAAILLLSNAASAATDYEWDAGYYPLSNGWQYQANWNPGTSYPGTASGDTALINAATNYPTVVVNSSIGYPVDWVRIDAWTAGVNLELQVVTGGSLSVTHTTPSYILLRAGDTYNAKLYMDGDETTPPVLAVNNLDCRGGVGQVSYGDQGKAVVDIDADSTFGVTADVEVSGDVDFGGSEDFSIDGDLRISNDTTEMHKTGTGTVTVYGRIIINPGPGTNGAVLTIDAGSIGTN
ncbi:MAG: hypothetical protein PVJ57_22565 [Phycisphaerae bacterium]|jgi:hypothetical protein